MIHRSVAHTCRSLVLLLLLWVLPTTLLGVLPLLAAVGEKKAVSIRVSPAASFEPANLFVQVRVERNDENRGVRVTAESPSYFGSSEGELDGARSAPTRTVRFLSVPAGEYEVRAIIFGQGGRVKSVARTTAIVLGR